MPKEHKEKHFIKPPVYEGGLKAMRAFISQALRYPAEALKEGIEGTVYLKYSIDYRGNVKDVKVISSLGYGCDEEAIRLVKLLQFKVGKIRRGKIYYNKNLQIHFRLPKKQAKPVEQPSPMQINYHITKAEDKPSKGSSGYTITIPS